MSKEFSLSASRIEEFNKCSLTYYYKYILKGPDESNDGAKRGSVCHDVFEVFIKEEYKDSVNQILNAKTIKEDKKLLEMVYERIKHYELGEEDNKGNNNFNLIEEMILVGFSHDFYCEGAQIDYENLEKRFKIESDNPKYNLVGLIDKPVIRDGKYEIYDYKSSSSKKVDKDLELSHQALSYGLYAMRVLNMDSWVKFVFLRFPEDPIQKVSYTKDMLEGFEYYLADMYERMSNFSEDDAFSNLAYDKGYPKDGTFSGAMCCGYAKYPNHKYPEKHKDPEKRGKPYFSCMCAFPFEYYVALNENGEIVKSSKNEQDLAKYERVEKKYWQGCPRKTNTKEFEEWVLNQ